MEIIIYPTIFFFGKKSFSTKGVFLLTVTTCCYETKYISIQRQNLNTSAIPFTLTLTSIVYGKKKVLKNLVQGPGIRKNLSVS